MIRVVNWDTTVAMATPLTPIFRTMTKTRSSMIFKMVVTIRKYRGVFESPRPRNTALIPLNPK